MFTGIVSELGSVRRIEPAVDGSTIEIHAPATTKDLAVGDSVAVNGACLTAIAVGPDTFVVQAVRETLDRTALDAVTTGDLVDLERPVPIGGRLDGHIVQGHVDGVGEIVSRDAEGDGERVRVSVPPQLARYLVEKGSVTVDGVSLTVTAVSDPGAARPWFEVALIPHTLGSTVLGRARNVGSRVNLEVDILAKYVERLMETRP